MTMIIGTVADRLNSAEWAAEANNGCQTVETIDGSGDSGIISLRSGGSGDGTPEMYFFDLTNVNSGDRFIINALNNVSGAGATQAGYLGPVSFDLFTTIPEPSATLFGAIGFLALLKRKRI
jgi:hypothetical protein